MQSAEKNNSWKERVNYVIENGVYVGNFVNLPAVVQGYSLDDLMEKSVSMGRAIAGDLTERFSKDDPIELKEVSKQEFRDSHKYASLQQQGGMRWVSARDQMPAKEGRTVVKRFGEAMIADAVRRANGEMVFATPNNMTWKGFKDFEWLHESQSPFPVHDPWIDKLKQLIKNMRDKNFREEIILEEVEKLIANHQQ